LDNLHEDLNRADKNLEKPPGREGEEEKVEDGLPTDE